MHAAKRRPLHILRMFHTQNCEFKTGLKFSLRVSSPSLSQSSKRIAGNDAVFPINQILHASIRDSFSKYTLFSLVVIHLIAHRPLCGSTQSVPWASLRQHVEIMQCLNGYMRYNFQCRRRQCFQWWELFVTHTVDSPAHAAPVTASEWHAQACKKATSRQARRVHLTINCGNRLIDSSQTNSRQLIDQLCNHCDEYIMI
jgi:hypothetical protein